MNPDDLRAVFDEERPYHPDWPASFGMVLSPIIMTLLNLYFKHPQARRSTEHAYLVVGRRVHAPRIRPPDIRPRPITPFKPRPLDQKQLASGEKPDDD